MTIYTYARSARLELVGLEMKPIKKLFLFQNALPMYSRVVFYTNAGLKVKFTVNFEKSTIRKQRNLYSGKLWHVQKT